MKIEFRGKWATMTALIAAGLTTCAWASGSAAPAAPHDDLQSWIEHNAVPVRTVDPTDEDFKDLEFLQDAIGNARLVQLGESTHEGGNGFSAKARLVKFLHERMGFDVLVWEEGIYDTRLMQAGLRGSEDVVSVAKRGLRTNWAGSEEVRPLLEYAKASLSGIRPLEMAGYDSRMYRQSFDQFAPDLRAFASALRDANARKRSQDLVESALSAYSRICCTQDAEPGQQDDLDNLHRTADALLAEIAKDHRLFEQVHGARETSYMERAVESLRSDGTGQFYMAQIKPGIMDRNLAFSRFWAQRDEQGARNLRWLIEQGFPGRKIIFWAHNVHVMNAYTTSTPIFKEAHVQAQPGDIKPVGVYMAEWLGQNVYTICLTHYEGEDGLTGAKDAKPIPAAPPGSLEARLQLLGKPYQFVNLRAARANPKLPVHSPLSMRLMSPGNYTVSDPTKVVDGVFYIERLTPATPVAKHD